MSGWDSAESWYSGCVGEKGHYYHQAVVLPNALRLLDLNKTSSLLDLGCGQGVLARHIPKEIDYVGIDLSEKLIAQAKQSSRRTKAAFFTADASQSLPLEKTDFDRACFLLSLQNMENPERAIATASRHLQQSGKLLLVLNHPCFRIPRQSGWGIDEHAKLQYRRVNGYMTPMQIPLQIHPGKGDAAGVTISYHHPLSSYMGWLQKYGFAAYALEEWCSDKKSEGAKARMENRARREIPLFLALAALLFKKPSS